MGKPVGKLPPEYQDCAILKTLFGEQSFQTYPSFLRGMTYHLQFETLWGCQVHLGSRQGTIFCRLSYPDAILEYIPPAVFKGQALFDLPSPLVEDCVHWLNLTTGIVDIRPIAHIWNPHERNWKLDVRRRQLTRGTDVLIDPSCTISRQVAKIFNGFEEPYHLRLIQPIQGNLVVELRRLKLSFTVNNNHNLQSAVLRCEIDRD